MFGVLGTIPTQGEAVSLDGWRFTAEKVQGRRVTDGARAPRPLVGPGRGGVTGVGRAPLPAAVLHALHDRLGDRVSVRPADLDAAARDASSLPASAPDVVVWPLATDEVAGRRPPRRGARASRSPRAAPARASRGTRSRCAAASSSTARAWRACWRCAPEDLQVDVQPGVVYAALNRALRPHGLFFPPSPGGSADVATIGGMVANNASGIYSVRYGGTRDHVRAATVVTGDRRRAAPRQPLPEERVGLPSARAPRRLGGDARDRHRADARARGPARGAAPGRLPLPRRDRPRRARRPTLIRFGVDVAAIEFLDARTVAAIEPLRAPRARRGADACWSRCTAARPASTRRGARPRTSCAARAATPLVLPDGRDAWSIREHATRAIAAQRPDAATVRADLAIPIGALPALVERCEALAAERGARRPPLRARRHRHPARARPRRRRRARRRPRRRATRSSTPRSRSAARARASTAWASATARYAAREHGAALALMQGVKALFDPHGILNPGQDLVKRGPHADRRLREVRPRARRAQRFDPETRRLVREGVPGEVSSLRPARARRARWRCARAHGGEVVALTMGPPAARDGLVECLALGADRARAPAATRRSPAPTRSRRRARSRRPCVREAPDLVLLGRASIDAETGQVGPEVAELLDLPQATAVAHARRSIPRRAPSPPSARPTTASRRSRARCRRVITAAEDIAEERFPTKAERAGGGGEADRER